MLVQGKVRGKKLLLGSLLEDEDNCYEMSLKSRLQVTGILLVYR